MSTTSEIAPKKTAGAFDIRNVIGVVIGVFGVILLVMGLFFSPQDELDKAGGIHANRIAGIVMILGGLIFGAWSWLRPVVLPAEPAVGRSADDEAALQHPSGS